MKAKRTDTNQDEIVKALRKIGYSVAITSGVGNGFVDIVVGAKNRTFLFEIKRNKKEKLTPKEKYFQLTWQGHYAVITSIEDAIDIITKL